MTPPTSNLRILSIGDDPSLLYIRELVLRQDGHSVRSVLSTTIPAGTEQQFDAAVLCHSIPLDTAESIARRLHAQYANIDIILFRFSRMVMDLISIESVAPLLGH